MLKPILALEASAQNRCMLFLLTKQIQGFISVYSSAGRGSTYGCRINTTHDIHGLYVFHIEDKKMYLKFLKKGFDDGVKGRLGKTVMPGQKTIE